MKAWEVAASIAFLILYYFFWISVIETPIIS